MEVKNRQHTFRLSESLHRWLKIRAMRNNRSLSGEMLQLLEERRNSEENCDFSKEIDEAFSRSHK